ncbi:MAG: hypothetical protein AB2L18_07190 [Anaerolineaceae bacterium]
MNQILQMLAGGDHRSIGRANEVVRIILQQPEKFNDLFQGFYDSDPIIMMRTADAVEKITADKPDLLVPYKQELIDLIEKTGQMEVQWHLTQILPRLQLTKPEIFKTYQMIEKYLVSSSAIVKAFTYQCFFELTLQEPDLLPQTRKYLENGMECPTKAVQSRCRKLLKEIDKYEKH